MLMVAVLLQEGKEGTLVVIKWIATDGEGSYIKLKIKQKQNKLLILRSCP